MDSIKNIKITSFDDILDKLKYFKYVPSIDVEYYIKNPINAYIKEILPQKEKNYLKRLKIENIIEKIGKKYYNHSFTNEIIDKNLIQEIFDEFDTRNNFSFLDSNSKKRRYLFKFHNMWTTNLYNKYKNSYMLYLLSNDKFYNHFKHILQLYVQNYSVLKNDYKFKKFFIDIFEKYKENRKYIPGYLQNLLDDCDLLSKNIAKDLAKISLQKKKNTNIDIVNIILTRYKVIKPHTDLYNEIIFTICDECKKNINDEFYFNLLFKEILQSNIDNKQSGNIVGDIITLFGENNNISQNDLEKIKLELLNNTYYGDPREQRVISNWANVNPVAKQIFITWLAQADLDFFFKIAFKGIPDPHRRKDFWQMYINSRQLVESQIVWSNKHIATEEIREEQKRNNTKYKRFRFEEECSCFILKFNKIYIVEFSESGHALYFYSENEFNRCINLQKTEYNWAGNFKKTQARQYTGRSRNIPDLNLCGSFTVYHSQNWRNLVKEVLDEYGIYK